MIVPVLLLMAAMLGPLASAQFMDCPGNEGGQGKHRVCCRSNELPKDCECYDISPGSLFANTDMTPKCPADIKVSFNLYTRADRLYPQKIRTGANNIKATRYNGSKKTVFIVHGFNDQGSNPWCINMKNALLDKEDLNVIVVDWQQGAKGLFNYKQAAANTRTVGSMIGRLIQDLHMTTRAAFGTFHLIGHSLGAHIMGYAGKEVFRLTNQKVGRISGLDPAGPIFEKSSRFARLDRMDGQFVDVIHTHFVLGIRQSVGHIDFYPKGPFSIQPGCLDKLPGCSHSLVLLYYIDSINTCPKSPANACTMGYYVSTSCSGNLYPSITKTAPFCPTSV